MIPGTRNLCAFIYVGGIAIIGLFFFARPRRQGAAMSSCCVDEVVPIEWRLAGSACDERTHAIVPMTYSEATRWAAETAENPG